MTGHCFTCAAPFEADKPLEFYCDRCRPRMTWGEDEVDYPPSLDPLSCDVRAPFTVLVDTREQAAYLFTGMKADARQGRKRLGVPLKKCTLGQGDYSIDGYADKVAVERKSYSDLAQTLTTGRERFVRELERLSSLTTAWVVCEVSLRQMMLGPPQYSEVLPKSLWRSIMGFQVQFPKVHWWLVESREVAEVTTYRLLEKWCVEWVEKPMGEARKRERAKGTT